MDASALHMPPVAADQPESLVRWRAEARELLVRLGLPGHRDEHWRRADLCFLGAATRGIEAPAAPAAGHPVVGTPELAGLRAGIHLCFDSGRFVPALSRLVDDDAVRVGRLAAARASGGVSVPALAPHAGLIGDLRLALLSRAAAADGAQIVVLRGRTPSRPLVLEHLGSGLGPGTAFVSHRLCVEPGASATLVEFYDDRSARDFSLLGELSIELGASSRLLHVRVVAPTHGAHLVDTLRVDVGRDADYVQRTLAAPAVALRSTQALVLAGDGAHAVLHAGVFARRQADVDLRVLAEHAADTTRSEQTVHVLAAAGRATVDSEALVPPGRRRVHSRQSLRALLLEPGSDVALRPRLAIRSDDVDSRHGATTAALPQDALFYLRSRGLHARQAQRLLVWAHLRQLFPTTGDEALDAFVQGAVQAALASALVDAGGAAA